MTGGTLQRALGAALVLVFASLIIGQLLGQPVLVAYVESGSMEPTIETGDGFVAVPALVAPSPQEGDVVTFYAEEIDNGGLTTHRVVGETEAGYVTRGDANPFTDQDGGEPPVTEEQIVAEALQVGDTVVTIPGLGTGIEAVRGAAIAAVTTTLNAFGLESEVSSGAVGVGIFGVGVVLFVASLRPTGGDGPERDVTRTTDNANNVDARRVAVVLLAVVLVPANAAMLAPAGPTDVVLDGDEVAEAADVSPGDPVEAEFDVNNGGLITLFLVFDPASEDVSVEPTSFGVPVGETATATVTAPAPPPGVERTITVDEHRYLVVFPERVLLALHQLHPLAALAGINAFVGGAFVGFVGGLLGFREVRLRDTSRDLPLRVRIKQWLR